MMLYSRTHISNSHARNAMIYISLMKIFSSLFTEIVNITLISSEDESLEIIKDFVALTIIADLDSLYA